MFWMHTIQILSVTFSCSRLCITKTLEPLCCDQEILYISILQEELLLSLPVADRKDEFCILKP